MIVKPFKRIARPFKSPSNSYLGSAVEKSYILKNDYATNRTTAIRAYHVIESDLIRLFEYVEPDVRNLTTFSTRLYEILLRASTEFESNCKAILAENGYSRDGNWTMIDYKKIDLAMRLSEYSLRLPIWADVPREIRPLSHWKKGSSLPWYTAYNSVKHNRITEFKNANLENAVDALGALFVVLFGQFNILTFSAHELVNSYNEWEGWLAHHNSIFSIKLPDTWREDDCYDFSESTACDVFLFR